MHATDARRREETKSWQPHQWTDHRAHARVDPQMSNAIGYKNNDVVEEARSLDDAQKAPSLVPA